MDRIDRIIAEVDGPTVLDLGAVQHDLDKTENDDWLHQHLVNQFERVVGVDILAEEIQQLNQQGYEMYQADVTEMSLDIEADTIVAGELIEHIANPGLMLERCQEHLKPGGKVVLSTPNPWGVPLLIRTAIGDLSINEEHVAWYTPQVMRQLLERYGFELVTAETTRRDHKGLMRIAQWLNSDYFGGTTWIFTGVKQ